ncbi:outer membrane beta-barrel protein [Hymenobacter sp. HMF4947]|uniref:Outer membrane beta-barrel protein n=1 Tax=Hymenobacter ginkgonis TaxID=2682976 RepID=A0A7K1TKQ2_9BACT|nr:porin family protein [Hymenobacter ginkgonis]MVN78953.1 outer membrane beta-barrel protein [Hymenobacter ginkgonis]
MKHLFLFFAGSLLWAGTAQAQTTFSIGPRVGLNVSSARFPTIDQPATSNRSGVEAGLTSTVQFGHFALQPSLLFSQKGYRTSSYYLNIDMLIPTEEDIRLNYLTLPLNLAYTLGRNGQGLQVFGGPYASLLVGGNYAQRLRGFDGETTGKIKPASLATETDNRYSRRFDGGLQAGVGYRLKGFQLQASYSLGLRNLAVPYQVFNGGTYTPSSYYNRAFQVSLSYLVGGKS